MFNYFFYYSGQRLLEEYESHLAKEEDRRDEAQARLEKSSRILIGVKSGVNHLAEKLAHLKTVRFVTGSKYQILDYAKSK